ncbi:MAG: Bug family tripartite tricarboxylate transporter substrate binding protein [Xanthobacteraceae bacterium]
MRRAMRGVLAALTLAWSAATAIAQDYPSRPIKIVIAFPAGGPTDFVGRLLADKMKEQLGQSVVIENKGGAGGTLGADYVAKSDPDGYTLFLTTVGAVAINPHLRTDMPYDSVKDFAPVSLVVRNTTVMVVRTENPVNSAKELAALAKEKPNTIPFASTGAGTTPHLALELFQAAADVKFLHVPYRGAAPALTDLLGGQVEAVALDVPVILSNIQGGKLKPLAAVSDTRNPMLPDVPTLAELGYPNTQADNWYALLAPAKTPPAIIAKLNAAVAKAVADPDVKNKLVQSGAIPAPNSPEEMGAMLKSELDRWGKIIREKGITGGS